MLEYANFMIVDLPAPGLPLSHKKPCFVGGMVKKPSTCFGEGAFDGRFSRIDLLEAEGI